MRYQVWDKAHANRNPPLPKKRKTCVKSFSKNRRTYAREAVFKIYPFPFCGNG